jgi:superfamily II DNA or RNA helicase
MAEVPGLGLSEVALTGAAGAYAAAPRAYTFLDPQAREDAAAWLRFVHARVPNLRAAGWEVAFHDDFLYEMREPDGPVAVEIETGGDNDWFGLSLGIEVDGERLDLQAILPAVLPYLAAEPADAPGPDGAAAPAVDDAAADAAADAPRSSYVRIGEGRYLALPTARLTRIAGALRGLFERPDAPGAAGTRPVTHLGELAELETAAQNGDITVTGGAALRALAAALRDGGGLATTPPPAGLAGVLRDYQQRGLAWLQALARHGFGGVLADDMGLGKTLQALAHVLAEKEQGRLDRPCLLVAPTSVVWTWRNEARRFAPDLATLVLHGTDRKTHFEQIPESDLVITTYALLPREAARLRDQAWHLVICDEAQALKNPDAQAARVLRQVTRRQLVCLSGTPVENHLEELWSLTQLAVPGLLGDRKTFRQVYRTPIEKHGDSARRAALARRLRPFLLRRTKDEVAGELPPRTETIEHVQLTGAQRDLYETVRSAMDKRVRDAIARRGVAQSQIMVMDALLKLRQVCCDPRLLKLDAAQGVSQSAKLERLMSMLADLTAEGRQVLVFSQFSSMLELIGAALSAAGHAYVSLTGQTRDRETPIQRFQAGEVAIFLISLKAGGTGLTLTAADTVIHYDPWWNPAAEAQAADRAHRIGQDKPVFVYRLIAEGTVEDRIVALQARKRDLAALVQDADGATGPALDARDIDALLAPVGETATQ